MVSRRPTTPRERRRRTQTERRALSERRLLDAATRLIADQGFSATTLAQIGEKAGYSRGLVTQRFGSKSGLIEALIPDIRERFGADHLAPALADTRGLEAVLIAVDTYLEALQRNVDEARALYVLMAESLGVVPEARPVFVRANRTFRSLLQRWIEQGIEAGEIRPEVQPLAQSGLVVGLLRGITLQWLVDPAGLDLQALRSETRASLQRSLERPGRHAPTRRRVSRGTGR